MPSRRMSGSLEHLHFHACGSVFASSRAASARCVGVQTFGGTIAEVAREVAAVGDRGADLDAAARRRRDRCRAAKPDAEAARASRRRVVAALELVETIELRARGFDAVARGLLPPAMPVGRSRGS